MAKVAFQIKYIFYLVMISGENGKKLNGTSSNHKMPTPQFLKKYYLMPRPTPKELEPETSNERPTSPQERLGVKIKPKPRLRPVPKRADGRDHEASQHEPEPVVHFVKSNGLTLLGTNGVRKDYLLAVKPRDVPACSDVQRGKKRLLLDSNLEPAAKRKKSSPQEEVKVSRKWQRVVPQKTATLTEKKARRPIQASLGGKDGKPDSLTTTEPSNSALTQAGSSGQLIFAHGWAWQGKASEGPVFLKVSSLCLCGHVFTIVDSEWKGQNIFQRIMGRSFCQWMK
jgi:hypothetical protein